MTEKPVLELERVGGDFSVCKFVEVPASILESEFCFVGKTDCELSVVCATDLVGAQATERDDGWSALRVRGPLDFGLVGILARIAGALAAAGVPLFAVSTFDTDYILVKSARFADAVEALRAEGCLVRL